VKDLQFTLEFPQTGRIDHEKGFYSVVNVAAEKVDELDAKMMTLMLLGHIFLKLK
jgi:hypothetical protein